MPTLSAQGRVYSVSRRRLLPPDQSLLNDLVEQTQFILRAYLLLRWQETSPPSPERPTTIPLYAERLSKRHSKLSPFFNSQIRWGIGLSPVDLRGRTIVPGAHWLPG